MELTKFIEEYWWPKPRLEVLEVKLEAKTPVHIGAGEKGEALLRILKMFVPAYGKEIPLIPRTTLKGVFRKTSEVLAISDPSKYLYKGFEHITKISIESHIGAEEGKHSDVNKEEAKKIYEELGLGEDSELLYSILVSLGVKVDRATELSKEPSSERNIKEIVELLLPLFCPICRLYGSLSFAGRVSFTDALPLKKEFKTLFKPSVSIERASLTARTHGLFFIETIPPGTQFSFTIVLRDIPAKVTEYELFDKTLNYFETLGIQVGGSKSRGMGLFKFNVLSRKEYNIV